MRAGEERLALTGDFTGDGVPDVLLTTRAMTDVYIYRNERGQKPDPSGPAGDGNESHPLLRDVSSAKRSFGDLRVMPKMKR